VRDVLPSMTHKAENGIMLETSAFFLVFWFHLVFPPFLSS